MLIRNSIPRLAAFLGATGLIATLTMVATPTAAADWWRDVDCRQHHIPGCDLGVGDDGHDGETGVRGPGDRRGGGDDSACSYSPATPEWVAEWEAVNGPIPDGQGLYLWQCEGSGQVWVILGPEGEAGPSPEELARQARARLVLPRPRIEANPAGRQLVGLPTWLWLDRGSWGSRSATVAVPGVSVTVTAVPTLAVWSMGDGGVVTCAGPGTPLLAVNAVDPARPSPDCGYVYRRSSAGAPDDRFEVRVMVRWQVRWAGAGESGEFPDLTTTAAAAFVVAESQAVNTSGR